MHKLRNQYSYSLVHALFNKSMWPYICYRARLFFINSLLKIILHIAEFYFIYLFFSPSLFHRLIIFRSITLILYGGWWGSLELLREHGRQAKQNRQLNTIVLEVKYWLLLTGFLLILINISTLICIHPVWSHHQSSDMVSFYVYLVAILIQLNLAFLVNVIHSGVYGVSRVYRPLISLLLPNVLSFIMMVSGWFIIGIYALPCAFILGAFLSVYFSLYYTMNMYKILNLSPELKLTWKGFKLFLQRVLNKEFLLAGLAGLFMTATGPFVIVIALFFGLQSWDYLTFLYIYMIIPILQLNIEWVFLFYFDLKKLLHRPYYLLLQRYQHYVYGFALITAVIAWLLAGLACLFYVGHWWITVWVLLPWLVFRSLLSYFQICAFVKRLYADVILSGLVVIISLIPFLKSSINIIDSFIGVFIALLIALIWLQHRRFSGHQSKLATDVLQPYFFWLYRIRSQPSDLTVYQIHLVNHIRYSQIITLINTINRFPQHDFLFTLANQQTLLGFQAQPLSEYQANKMQVIIAGAGLVEQVELVSVQKQNFKYHLMNMLHLSTESVTKMQVTSEFKRLFPKAIIYSLTSQQYDSIPAELCGLLLSGLRNFFERPWHVNRYGKVSVSALLEDGVATVLFIIDMKTTDLTQLQSWLNWLIPINNNVH